MIVRGLDANGDFLFGKGKNDYKKDVQAIGQNIKTRLYSFLGDCFFATDAGLDWWNLLGTKDQVTLKLSINATILNTEGVAKLLASDVNLASNRKITISYTVEHIFAGQSLSSSLATSTSFVLTEGGLIITTEDGQGLEGG